VQTPLAGLRLNANDRAVVLDIMRECCPPANGPTASDLCNTLCVLRAVLRAVLRRRQIVCARARQCTARALQ
jgi:hypothetical protein